ncbi:MAG: M48 family metalloprotease [Oligoflexales bacterium]|nr:M48 family metalloprotease [Oligoflexales bacterium]
MLKKLEWDYKITGLLLLASILFLALLVGKLIAGDAFFLFVGLSLFLGLGITSRLTSRTILRSLGAKNFNENDEAYLRDLSYGLVKEAGLGKVPKFFLIPKKEINALTFGSKEDPVIGISWGAMHSLTDRDMQGIIAHEIAHIKAGDFRLNQFLNLVHSFANFMTGFALISCLLSLPLIFAGVASVSMEIILFSLLTPLILMVLRLALSRNREYAADLEAVRLTKDPVGLANALRKSSQLMSLWGLIFRRGAGQSCPLLQSHPRVEDRIRRLLSLVSMNRSWGNLWYPAG